MTVRKKDWIPVAEKILSNLHEPWMSEEEKKS